MQISFTETAVKEIAKVWGAEHQGMLKLAFDTEGCGCAVNGVPTLWLVDQAEKQDLRMEGSPYEVLMDKKHEVYFEERMTVDYIPEGLRFVLKSSGQIYNAHMSLIDKRESVNSHAL